MSGRLLTGVIGLVIAVQVTAAAPALGADYRGMTAGWPSYANGYYAANYPANYGVGPAYYVARPVAAAATAGQPMPGMLYTPVRAAYANPTYFAAYGRSPSVYRPVAAVGYPPPATAYYPPAAGAYYAPAAPTAAYYAPVTANYASANSYAVSPAGINATGSEAAAYFGQPTQLNYVPPRFAYRTTYAPVPVYMYRPVTTYDPVAGQPVTCLQASTCNTCQPQRSRWFSWLHPSSWFGGSSCGSGGCGQAVAPTTTYCGTSGCGQPYYPVQPPVIPVVPGPATVLPPNAIPSTPAPALPFRTIPAQPTVPAYPTRPFVPGMTVPGTPGAFTIPANEAPSLAPRTTPAPGSNIFTPLPSTPLPAQPGTFTPLSPGSGTPAAPSFPTTPAAPPPTSFGPGSFGTGTNYAPPADPYSAALTPANSSNRPANGMAPSNPAPGGNLQTGPAHSVFGSGYRGSSPGRSDAPRPSAGDNGVIRAPDLSPALPPSVQTVPDLDAPQSPKPVNSAPQLLDPRDKTARADKRWAVVPAQWPKKDSASRQLGDRPVAPTKAYQPQSSGVTATSPYVHAPSNSSDYDDRGWKSAASF